MTSPSAPTTAAAPPSAPPPASCEVASQKPHLHYMRLALAQARRATKLPTNFRVGAVIVDGRRISPDSLTFSPVSPDGPAPAPACSAAGPTRALELDEYILATGFTGELPGNTHAEECAIEKLHRHLRAGPRETGDCHRDVETPIGAEDDDDDVAAPPRTRSRSGSTLHTFDDDAAPLGMHSSAVPGHRQHRRSSLSSIGSTILEDAVVVSSPARPRRLSTSSGAGQPGLVRPGPAQPSEPESASAPGQPDLLLYTTMEPCSLRLSGREPCVSRILKAAFEQPQQPRPHRKHSGSSQTDGLDIRAGAMDSLKTPAAASRQARADVSSDAGAEPKLDAVLAGDGDRAGGLPRIDTDSTQPPSNAHRRITHVFVGIREPDTFVENNTSCEILRQEGIKYLLVPGLEAQILKTANSS